MKSTEQVNCTDLWRISHFKEKDRSRSPERTLEMCLCMDGRGDGHLIGELKSEFAQSESLQVYLFAFRPAFHKYFFKFLKSPTPSLLSLR